jgi:hypothetical protein
MDKLYESIVSHSIDGMAEIVAGVLAAIVTVLLTHYFMHRKEKNEPQEKPVVGPSAAAPAVAAKSSSEAFHQMCAIVDRPPVSVSFGSPNAFPTSVYLLLLAGMVAGALLTLLIPHTSAVWAAITAFIVVSVLYFFASTLVWEHKEAVRLNDKFWDRWGRLQELAEQGQKVL